MAEKGALLVFTCHNVTAFVDAATGEVVERCVYDPHGRATFLDAAWQPSAVPGQSYGAVSARSNEVLFAGYRHDPETGNFHVRARQYLPTLAVWLTRDPAGCPTGTTGPASARAMGFDAQPVGCPLAGWRPPCDGLSVADAGPA